MNIEFADIQRELWKLVNDCSPAYKDCADAKIEFTRLDKREKSKLAVLCMKFSDGKLAENKVTRLALASEEYQAFLDERDLAEAKYIAAQSKVDSLEMKAGLVRSAGKMHIGEFESTKSFQ